MTLKKRIFKKMLTLLPLVFSVSMVASSNANASASISPYVSISCSGTYGYIFSESDTYYTGSQPNKDMVAAVVSLWVWDSGVRQWLFSGNSQTPWEYVSATATKQDSGSYLYWTQAYGGGWWWEYDSGITTWIPWQPTPVTGCY